MMEKTSVFSVTSKMIYKLNALAGTPVGKSTMAKFRNSIGKNLENSTELWPILFENLPAEFFGNGKNITKEENAILLTLQLYALYMQGNSDVTTPQDDDTKFKNIGFSLKALRVDDTMSSDRRFNATITSTTVEELVNHLRHMIKILKSKYPKTYIDFPKLAEDIYWFSKGYEDTIRLSWAREYFRK
ncbi:type I-E CRISPR-associated protein Cse2/CasB [Peptostreptococcus stomatis]|uniref:type I-E CRISPR-associated protein Cse2/CasB n=1 Tax=Peptostreptococcus stomatis TaxID=341694 RepID=UPI0028D8AD50|nr:type I-E CRISPR-associated protein Cse2/CasB [Peptostreptococcus stomatis]